jgi:hypothetical protein
MTDRRALSRMDVPLVYRDTAYRRRAITSLPVHKGREKTLYGDPLCTITFNDAHERAIQV